MIHASMIDSARRKKRRISLAWAIALTLAGSAVMPAFAADRVPSGEAASTIPPEVKISPELAAADGPVAVYVQFSGQGAYAATQPESVKENRAAPVDAAQRVSQIRDEIEQTAQDVSAEASATALYTTTNTLPGVALNGDAAELRELSNRPDVVKITPIVPKTIPENKNTVIDTRALNTWVKTGQTGQGVKVAVIDSGVDYTHTGFGGPGTQEAFNQAAASPELVPGTYDPQKFIGGYDLAGDSYNASTSSPDYQPVPNPDNNPLDCRAGGHGTHVAGTVAGYGVNEDGTTFRAGQNGNPQYSELTADQVGGMRIGPGSAPEAQLMAFRVFGCAGSTNLTIQALDRALDPNQDGNFDDRADIVNLSLGSTYAPAADPENDVIGALTRNGVLSVISSGNSGDFYDIGGTPGNAESALTVANSVGSRIALDRVDVLAPQRGQAVGQYSGFDPSKFTAEQLTGTMVNGPAGQNADGCQPFSAEDAARVDGQWVWLSWDENSSTRRCGSTARFDNAEKAGAKGVVLDSSLEVFGSGIAGNQTIPGVQLTKSFSDQLRPDAEAGTLRIRLSAEYKGTGSGPTNALDTLNPSSSRGVHGSNGIVKPDVAAPGTSIGSVAVGSGNGASVKSGTSMSAPLVSGIAALVMAKTKLPALDVKSIVMNTANQDVYRGENVYGPGRVGSGRVDALDAVTTEAYAFATDDPELTSVNFGVLEVTDQPVSITRQVTVKNTGSTARDYSVQYLPATTVPGVEYQTGSTVSVPAQGSSTVDITLTITDPTALRKTLDPTMDRVQGDRKLPRQFIAEASGRLELSAPETPTLRVPVYTAPKPVSAMTAGESLEFSDAEAQSTGVDLNGRPLAQGPIGGDGYNSLLGAFELQSSSPRQDKVLDEGSGQNSAVRSMDLQYVGVSSNALALKAAGLDPNDADIQFGISTWGNWAALSNFYRVYVDIDTNADGKDDFQLRLGNVTGVDLPVAALYRYQADGRLAANPDAIRPLNGLDGSVDSNTMDTNVMVLPVYARDLGLDLNNPAPLSYQVTTYSSLKVKDGRLVPVDQTEPKTFDPANPSLWFDDGTGSALFLDKPETTLTANRSAGLTDAKALFLHLQNATGNLGADGDGGQRAEVLPIAVIEPEPTTTSTPTPTPTDTTAPPGNTGEPTTATPSPGTDGGGNDGGGGGSGTVTTAGDTLSDTGVPQWLLMLGAAAVLITLLGGAAMLSVRPRRH